MNKDGRARTVLAQTTTDAEERVIVAKNKHEVFLQEMKKTLQEKEAEKKQHPVTSSDDDWDSDILNFQAELERKFNELFGMVDGD